MYIRSIDAERVLWIRDAWNSCRIEWDWNVSTAIDKKKLGIHFLWPTYTQPSQWILISDCVTISSILNIKYSMSIEHRVLNARFFSPHSHSVILNGTDWPNTECRWKFCDRKKEIDIYIFFSPDSKWPPNWQLNHIHLLEFHLRTNTNSISILFFLSSIS